MGLIEGFEIVSNDNTALDHIAQDKKIINGDLIMQINHMSINSKASLASAIQQLFIPQTESIITFHIQRAGVNHLVALNYKP